MPTTSGTRTITYPSEGDTAWFSSFQTYSQSLTTYLDNLAKTVTDTNGNELLAYVSATNAINYIQIANAATGNSPAISAQGDDTNIGLSITPKGSGALNLDGLLWPTADGSASQFLQTDGGGNLTWASALTTAPSAINDLSDVTITSVGDNELLQYDTGTASWINRTISEIGLQVQDQALDDIAGLSLVKGDIFTTTGTNIVRLGVGTSGQVLTVVSSATNGIAWVTPSAGSSSGAIEFIEEVSGSNVSSIESAGWDTSTYSSFLVEVINVLPTTDGAQNQIRFTTNSGTSFASGASDYEWRTIGSADETSQSDTHMSMIHSGEWGNVTSPSEGLSGHMWILDAASSTRYTAWVGQCHGRDNEAGTYIYEFGGRYNQSGTVNGFQMSASTGNVSGRFRIYGIKAS